MHVIEDAVVAAILANNAKRVYVAYSGGSDSTALLVALNNVVNSIPLIALHVNHGLQDQSNEWEKHCVDECHRLGVKIQVGRINLSSSGNIEALAREKRYAFFARFVEKDDLLFVGHHLEDQIETSLMRVFQGRGFIQMPGQRKLGKGSLIRPFLKFKSELLREYLSELGYTWVEDDSNNDQSFSRNYIRSAILPVVLNKWPDYAENFSKVLSRTKNVEKILEGFFERLPDLVKVSELPSASDAKLVWIRNYIESRGHFRVSERQLKIFVEKIENSETAIIELDHKVIGFYRDAIYYEVVCPNFKSEITVTKFPYELDIGWGVLVLQEVLEKDHQTFCCSGELIIKFGSGNRKIKLMNSNFKKSVKNLLNERALPQWRRPGFPLIFANNNLICLPDIGVDISSEQLSGLGIKRLKATIQSKYDFNKV